MFEVDRKGLSELLMNEEPSRFAYELIQNSWDEDDVTRVEVILRPIPRRQLVELIVTDDSPNGFRDLADAYTLFKASYKKGIADKRGRFNLGEKIVIAVAHKAVIETTTGTVKFEKGVRSHSRKKRAKGSRVTVWMPWTRKQMEEVEKGLKQLIPPHRIETVVNGHLLGYRTPVATTSSVLQTVLEREDGTLGTSYRRTDVKVYECLEGEKGAIYEMGIPVVEIGDPWHADICQKVPLTVDRKNVPPSYLRDVRAAVLNVMSDSLTKEEAQENWADDALESDDIKEEAVVALMTKRFGEKRVSYDPSDQEANNLAVAKGYTVVHGGNLSRKAWGAVRGAGAILPAGRVTPSNATVQESADGVKPIPVVDWTKNMRRFSTYATEFADRVLDAKIVVQFYPMPSLPPGQKDWIAAYKPGHLSVNLRVAKQLLEKASQYEWDKLLIHEFGHHMERNHLSEDYHEALCHIGAKLHNVYINP